MKFLIDECLRPVVAAGLAAAGHDAVHVGEVDLLGATDDEVMAFTPSPATPPMSDRWLH